MSAVPNDIPEVSEHLVRVWRFLQTRGEGWTTANEVAEAASIASSTARGHLRHLTRMKVVEKTEIHPSNRYRISPEAEEKNPAYLNLLRSAEEAVK